MTIETNESSAENVEIQTQDNSETQSSSEHNEITDPPKRIMVSRGPIDCIDCDKSFTLTEEEIKEFESRGFQTPKRCKECRIARRKNRKAQQKKTAKGKNKRNKGQKRNRRNPQQDEAETGNILYGSPDPGLAPSQGSYVAQGELHRESRENLVDDGGPDQYPEYQNKQPRSPEDADNFGNSIHYQGPGVDVRYGTARDDGANFAPWEGAHGYLLTSHEPSKQQNKKNQKKNAKNKRGNGSNANDKKGVRAKGEGRKKNQKKRSRSNGRAAHDIVCEECGIETKVPFKPIPGKPVFCRDCHKKLLEKQRSEKKAGGEDAAQSGSEEAQPPPLQDSISESTEA